MPYLDCNATTREAPDVRAAVRRAQADVWGNASSRDHSVGWEAAHAVEDARSLVADAFHRQPRQVAFTSGATESINTVVRSFVGYDGWDRKAIVTAAAEHDAVLAPARELAARTGVRLTILPVDAAGHVRLDHLTAALRASSQALVVLAAANSEIGTLYDLPEIVDVVQAARAVFLCDTTQAVGKHPVDLPAAVDFATISAHKCYGPKGIGALLMRDPAAGRPEPLLFGGGQERGLRGGTLNVPGIVGMGEACRLVSECLDDDMARMQRLRDRLEDGIVAQLPNVWINGDRGNRLCNTSSMGFTAVDARALIRDMHDIAVSTRSACSSGDSGPSHVLKAIGLSDADAYSCIRFSLGRFTTLDEIDYAVGKVVASAHKLRRAKSARR